MQKYKGKYRIQSARWKIWDYGSNAAYFVTICTANRTHDFGQISSEGEMILTPLGEAAWDCWLQIPDHFPFGRLGAFVVMPNHVHGIIVIDKPTVETQNLASTVDTQNLASAVDTQDFASAVETQDFASLHPRPVGSQNKFGPQSQNLASIVRGFKIGVTKFAQKQDILFKWQTRYHDHVIRDEEEYTRIEDYIHHNPTTWQTDSLFQ